jgi:hypothetical protein
MKLSTRILGIALSATTIFALAGCEAYFGTNEGTEPGDQGLFGFDRTSEAQGSATFDIIGISPSVVAEGDQVTIYSASAVDAPTDQFENSDFWYCFFDGESAMLETGGDDYTSEVGTDDVLDDPDLETELTAAELDEMTVSTTTVTVPDGTVSGDGLFFNPFYETRDFYLSVE